MISAFAPTSIVLLRFCVLLFCLLLGACDTLSYYGQAISGQLYILTHREDIDRLLASPDTDPTLKTRLREIQELRRFAEEELKLPLDSQYSTYVDLQRPYVVWNVFAADEFSLQLQSWCFPVAGCVNYRGYFREAAARDFAGELRGAGRDVYVGGVAAYSTLGWFSDPVLSTIIDRQKHQLAALLFHELAHQVVYFPGDTEFNESFATAVEREGVERWLALAVTDFAENSILTDVLTQETRRQDEFVALVQAAAGDLGRIYTGTLEREAMRAAKSARLRQLQVDYAALKGNWGGYDGYDAWFANDLNNAKLATVSTYNALVPEFRALLRRHNGDFAGFYAAAATLAELDPQVRRERLRELVP